MDRFPTNNGVIRRLDLAIREAGHDVHSVALAADITSEELTDRLTGRVEITLDELVRVGGFLRVPATHFIKEAA